MKSRESTAMTNFTLITLLTIINTLAFPCISSAENNDILLMLPPIISSGKKVSIFQNFNPSIELLASTIDIDKNAIFIKGTKDTDGMPEAVTNISVINSTQKTDFMFNLLGQPSQISFSDGSVIYFDLTEEGKVNIYIDDGQGGNEQISLPVSSYNTSKMQIKKSHTIYNKKTTIHNSTTYKGKISGDCFDNDEVLFGFFKPQNSSLWSLTFPPKELQITKTSVEDIPGTNYCKKNIYSYSFENYDPGDKDTWIKNCKDSKLLYLMQFVVDMPTSLLDASLLIIEKTTTKRIITSALKLFKIISTVWGAAGHVALKCDESQWNFIKLNGDSSGYIHVFAPTSENLYENNFYQPAVDVEAPDFEFTKFKAKAIDITLVKKSMDDTPITWEGCGIGSANYVQFIDTMRNIATYDNNPQKISDNSITARLPSQFSLSSIGPIRSIIGKANHTTPGGDVQLQDVDMILFTKRTKTYIDLAVGKNVQTLITDINSQFVLESSIQDYSLKYDHWANWNSETYQGQNYSRLSLYLQQNIPIGNYSLIFKYGEQRHTIGRITIWDKCNIYFVDTLSANDDSPYCSYYLNDQYSQYPIKCTKDKCMDVKRGYTYNVSITKNYFMMSKQYTTTCNDGGKSYGTEGYKILFDANNYDGAYYFNSSCGYISQHVAFPFGSPGSLEYYPIYEDYLEQNNIDSGFLLCKKLFD